MNANAVGGPRPDGKLNTIKVERMSCGGVGQRGHSAAAFEARANYSRIWTAFQPSQVTLQNEAAFLDGAGKHGADGINNQRFGSKDNLVRQCVEAGLVNEADNIFGY